MYILHHSAISVHSDPGGMYITAKYLPTANPKTIAVGASDKADSSDPFGRAFFSNWGSYIDVVAPGVSIHSTGVRSVAQGLPGTADYFTQSGTSFSAPLVAGLAALILSKYPTFTNEQVRAFIKETAVDLPDDPNDYPDAGDDWDGAGMIQFSLNIDSPIFGDVNEDGLVNSLDASLILRTVVGTIELSDDQRLKADVTGNGEVTAYDAYMVLQFTVGLLDIFPVKSKTTQEGK